MQEPEDQITGRTPDEDLTIVRHVWPSTFRARVHRIAGWMSMLTATLVVGVWLWSGSTSGPRRVEFKLASPWPAPAGIMPLTGAFLRRPVSAPALVFADRHGDIHWLVDGLPQHAKLLGAGATARPFCAADLTEDGYDELILTSQENQVTIFDGREGSRLATTNWFTEPITTPPAISAGPTPERLIGVHGRDGKFGVYVASDASTFHREQYFNGHVPSGGTWYDLDGDGLDEYAVCSDNGVLVVLEGNTGQLSTLELGPIVWRSHPMVAARGLDVGAPICFCEYTGDRRAELVFLTRRGDLIVFDLASMSILAHEQLTTDTIPAPADYPGPLLADLDRDGRDEIIVAHTSGTLYAFGTPRVAGHPLTPFWPPVPTASASYAPALADLNGDRIPEVVLTTRDGELIVVNGRRGDYLFQTPLEASGPPLLADADDDGRVEIFVAGDRQWTVIDTDVKAATQSQWFQWRGTPDRRAAFQPGGPNAPRPWALTFWLALVFVGSVSLWFKT